MYRYEPGTDDIEKLSEFCLKFDGVKFKFLLDNNSGLLRLCCWSSKPYRSFEKILTNDFSPDDIYNLLKTKFPHKT